MGLCFLAILLCAPVLAAEKGKMRGETRQERSCPGTTYFNCICPGDKVCARDDGEYDYPPENCNALLVTVTAQNIDNIVGNLRLIDPPCKEPDLCRRVSVVDLSSPPDKDPACRCREKTAICKPKRTP
jgi:hypothetical protein